MSTKQPETDSGRTTNENWTQRYVDYDKEEPQPRDISNDYIKEEMVGNVRGVFIKTRNLESDEVENPTTTTDDNTATDRSNERNTSNVNENDRSIRDTDKNVETNNARLNNSQVGMGDNSSNELPPRNMTNMTSGSNELRPKTNSSLNTDFTGRSSNIEFNADTIRKNNIDLNASATRNTNNLNTNTKTESNINKNSNVAGSSNVDETARIK